MADFERDDDMPLSGEEKRRLKRRNPTGTVPENLAALDESAPPSKTVKFIDRAAVRMSDTPATLEGYAPPWGGVSFAPKRVARPLPPTVTHRGERLDPLVIHQPDDRRTYNDPDTYPWRCVCRITRPDGRLGSGVLIGPRHVLTASHVVQWNTNVAERIEVHFAGNSALAIAFTEAAYAYTQITGPQVPSSEIDEDYAVIVLTQRLGERFGFFGTKLYDSSWDDDAVWDTIGYAVDIAQSNFPTFQRNVSLDETDLGSGRNMTTSADAMPIQSGSPMFGRWTGDLVAYAVAVMSATDGRNNWCAGGEDLNGIVRHARTQDP